MQLGACRRKRPQRLAHARRRRQVPALAVAAGGLPSEAAAEADAHPSVRPSSPGWGSSWGTPSKHQPINQQGQKPRKEQMQAPSPTAKTAPSKRRAPPITPQRARREMASKDTCKCWALETKDKSDVRSITLTLSRKRTNGRGQMESEHNQHHNHRNGSSTSTSTTTTTATSTNTSARANGSDIYTWRMAHVHT